MILKLLGRRMVFLQVFAGWRRGVVAFLKGCFYGEILGALIDGKQNLSPKSLVVFLCLFFVIDIGVLNELDPDLECGEIIYTTIVFVDVVIPVVVYFKLIFNTSITSLLFEICAVCFSWITILTIVLYEKLIVGIFVISILELNYFFLLVSAIEERNLSFSGFLSKEQVAKIIKNKRHRQQQLKFGRSGIKARFKQQQEYKSKDFLNVNSHPNAFPNEGLCHEFKIIISSYSQYLLV